MKYVVLVDDEKVMQIIIKMQFKEKLRKNIFGILFFSSGEECLNYIKTNTDLEISLIITDINMPKMDGYELVKNIKLFSPDLYIIIMSAYNDKNHVSRAFLAGANDYLTKPLNFKQLLTIIEKTAS